MATTSIPTRGAEEEPVDPLTIQPSTLPEPKKEEGRHEKHPQHPHHHHEPRIIHPVSSGTSHLDPGAINIKP
jgi:hypothetical protein